MVNPRNPEVPFGLRLAKFLLWLLSAMLLVAFAVILLPLVTPYFRNAAAYPWIEGIEAFGSWGNTLGERLFFLRDRKGVLSGIIAVIAYFLAFNAIAILILGRLSDEWLIAGYSMLDPTLSVVFFINMLLLLNRIIQRMIFTTSVYGYGQGLMAAPRVIFSNFINFAAALRALYIFIWRHRVRGKPLAWDKTAHTIPGQTVEAVQG